MKRVLGFRKVARDRTKIHLHRAWGQDWLFRHVRCGECGLEWWETVKPKRWATTGQECCG